MGSRRVVEAAGEAGDCRLAGGAPVAVFGRSLAGQAVRRGGCAKPGAGRLG